MDEIEKEAATTGGGSWFRSLQDSVRVGTANRAGWDDYFSYECSFMFSFLKIASPCTACIVDIRPGAKCLSVSYPSQALRPGAYAGDADRAGGRDLRNS